MKYKISRWLQKNLTSLPFIGWRLKLFIQYREIPFPPGHYYSSIPDLNDIEKRSEDIFSNDLLQDINLNLSGQQLILDELKKYYAEIPYNFSDIDKKNLKFLFNPKNLFYSFSDAIFLYCMLRHIKPNKVVEVGSGYSSAIMIDTNEHFLQKKSTITFIEPYPEERLNDIIRHQNDGNYEVRAQKVQETDLSIFKTLNQNDILFIDSSHVSKTGSDVNYIFFNILPSLKPGVYIHFHDIFYPFELPERWIMRYKRFWNENYLLRAFLMNNSNYEIVLFNNFLHKKMPEWFEKEMPECLINSENTGSIWLRKIK